MGLVSGRGGRERAVTPVSLPPTGICVGRRARRFTKGPAKSKRAAPAGCESIVSQCEHQFGNSLKANVLRSIRVRVSPVPRSARQVPTLGGVFGIAGQRGRCNTEHETCDPCDEARANHGAARPPGHPRGHPEGLWPEQTGVFSTGAAWKEGSAQAPVDRPRVGIAHRYGHIRNDARASARPHGKHASNCNDVTKKRGGI